MTEINLIQFQNGKLIAINYLPKINNTNHRILITLRIEKSLSTNKNFVKMTKS